MVLYRSTWLAWEPYHQSFPRAKSTSLEGWRETSQLLEGWLWFLAPRERGCISCWESWAVESSREGEAARTVYGRSRGESLRLLPHYVSTRSALQEFPLLCMDKKDKRSECRQCMVVSLWKERQRGREGERRKKEKERGREGKYSNSTSQYSQLVTRQYPLVYRSKEERSNRETGTINWQQNERGKVC